MSRSSLPPLEDDFARALLGSAEADAPSHTAYAKAATALGVGVGLGVGASLPAAAAVGAAGLAGVARWSNALGAKLLLLSVSGALLVGAGVQVLRSSNPAEPVLTAAPARGARVTPAPVEAKRPVSAAPAPRIQADSAPVAPSRSAVNTGSLAVKSESQSSAPIAFRAATLRPPGIAPSARRAPHAEPPRAPSNSSLAEQVQSLDRARVALSSGDSSAALAELARYRAAWPNGVFLTEASVLEIEALAVRGDRKLARERAADFVAAHPDSPQADRLRALTPSKKR